MYNALGISEKTQELVSKCEMECIEEFLKIDEACEYNSLKVLSSFHTNQVSDSCFNSTTGYGYNDLGRETIENIFKDVIQAYVDYAKKAPELSEADKDKKYDLIKGFSDKLVEKGGVAINNFKKTLGDKKTNEFLGNVLYGYLHIKE